MNAAEMFSVEGRGAVVTGGASGIGLAIVEVLAEHGARVTMLDMNAERLSAEVERLVDMGYDVRGRMLDVTDISAQDDAFAEAAALYGGLNIAFANAGVDPGPGFASMMDPTERPVEFAIENYDPARWKHTVAISLDAVFYSVRAAARHMKPNRSGQIIVTTSISAVRPSPGIGAAYMAAKAGAAHLVRTAALELARYNVRINAMAPGPFATNITNGWLQKPDVQAVVSKNIPIGRVARPEEIKGLALFLASQASSFVTGEQIVIDGGASLGRVE